MSNLQTAAGSCTEDYSSISPTLSNFPQWPSLPAHSRRTLDKLMTSPVRIQILVRWPKFWNSKFKLQIAPAVIFKPRYAQRAAMSHLVAVVVVVLLTTASCLSMGRRPLRCLTAMFPKLVFDLKVHTFGQTTLGSTGSDIRSHQTLFCIFAKMLFNFGIGILGVKVSDFPNQPTICHGIRPLFSHLGRSDSFAASLYRCAG